MEQFQEKCVAVFRPELRQTKGRAFSRFEEKRKGSNVLVVRDALDFGIIGRNRQTDQASVASPSALRPLKPFASRNISTDSDLDAPGFTWTT